MKRLGVIGTVLLLGACSTAGDVRVSGAFAAAPPSEIRYMLHQGYGLGAMDVAFAGRVDQAGHVPLAPS